MSDPFAVLLFITDNNPSWKKDIDLYRKAGYSDAEIVKRLQSVKHSDGWYLVREAEQGLKEQKAASRPISWLQSAWKFTEPYLRPYGQKVDKTIDLAQYYREHPKIAARDAALYGAKKLLDYGESAATGQIIKASRAGADVDPYADKALAKLIDVSTGSGLRRRRKQNHMGGTGFGGRGRPSAKQLAARRLFAARFGGRKRRRMR